MKIEIRKLMNTRDYRRIVINRFIDDRADRSTYENDKEQCDLC
jgi:hypothetical protein